MIQNAKYIMNNKYNGIEIYFNTKPTEEVLKELRNSFWRFHKYKRCWYNKHTEYTENFAKSLCDKINGETETETETVITNNFIKLPIKSNEHNVAVGDIFYTLWGYEQTNVNFYQVISITPKSAKVKHISSRIVDADSYMSGKVLPCPNSFIDDEIITTRTDFTYDNTGKLLKNADGKKHIGYEFVGKPVSYSCYH